MATEVGEAEIPEDVIQAFGSAGRVVRVVDADIRLAPFSQLPDLGAEAEAIERRLPLQKAVVAERRRLAAIAVDRVGEQVREAVRPLHAAALRSVGLAAAALLSGVDQVEAILTDVEGRGFSITGLPNVSPPGLRESIEMALLETLEVGAIEASDGPRGVAREIVALGVARRAEARDRAKAPPKPSAPRPPEKVATAGSAWSHIGRIPGRRL